MSIHVTLHGDGVEAVRTFLLTRILTDQQWKRTGMSKLLQGGTPSVLRTRDLRQIATLLDELRAQDASIPSLTSLLRQGNGVQVRLVTASKEGEEAEGEKEARSKYLVTRREKLKRLDEEMQYGSMVRNFQSHSITTDVTRPSSSTVRQHLSIGANMVMARVTAFVAVYFVAQNLTQNETTKLVAGLCGAIVMMVIEMVLFITRAAKIESFEHQQKKRTSGTF